MPVNRHPDLPSPEQLAVRRVYRLTSRNLRFGVWNGVDRFYGVRTKFKTKFIDTEFHWDADANHGTVAHAIDTGRDLPASISIHPTDFNRIVDEVELVRYFRELEYDLICWEGDWSLLPSKCGGNVEVWDQTIGCPECGMNLWYLPKHGQWPAGWNQIPEPPKDWWKNHGKTNPYEPYDQLMRKIHPFQFSDAHDDGDAHNDVPDRSDRDR